MQNWTCHSKNESAQGLGIHFCTFKDAEKTIMDESLSMQTKDKAYFDSFVIGSEYELKAIKSK